MIEIKLSVIKYHQLLNQELDPILKRLPKYGDEGRKQDDGKKNIDDVNEAVEASARSSISHLTDQIPPLASVAILVDRVVGRLAGCRANAGKALAPTRVIEVWQDTVYLLLFFFLIHVFTGYCPASITFSSIFERVLGPDRPENI